MEPRWEPQTLKRWWGRPRGKRKACGKSIRAAMRSAMLLVCCPRSVQDFAGSFSSSGKVVGLFQATWDRNIWQRRLTQSSPLERRLPHCLIEPVTFRAIHTRSPPARNDSSLCGAQQGSFGLVRKMRPKLLKWEAEAQKGAGRGVGRGWRSSVHFSRRCATPAGFPRVGIASELCGFTLNAGDRDCIPSGVGVNLDPRRRSGPARLASVRWRWELYRQSSQDS